MWGLGLRIQPVGLTYERKHLFRGRVMAAYGTPIDASQLRTLFERDDQEAVRQLTDAIREGLEAQTVNFRNEQDQELVYVAERMYAREKDISRPRARETRLFPGCNASLRASSGSRTPIPIASSI
jgi:glycerol-3-phosphate O-acyltransferase / dihydroxyacetone phosphate acyltransferase